MRNVPCETPKMTHRFFFFCNFAECLVTKVVLLERFSSVPGERYFELGTIARTSFFYKKWRMLLLKVSPDGQSSLEVSLSFSTTHVRVSIQ